MCTKTVAFAVLTFISSCSWFNPPKPTGTLLGSVMIMNPGGAAPADHSGVTVTASTDGVTMSTSTDVSGRWELKEVPSGTYVVSFSKAGYGMFKIPAYVFAAPGKARYVNSIPMYPLPQYDVTSVTVALQSGQVVVSGSLSGTPSGYRMAELFFGVSQSVSASPTEYLYTTGAGTTTNTFSVTVPLAYIKSAGAPVGATIYVTAYAMSQAAYYQDVETGRQVYYCLSASHSNTASFVVQ